MVREGQTFLLPAMSDNREYEITDIGSENSSVFKPDEGEVELSGSPPSLGGSTVELDELREEIDPIAIHRRRSDEARAADRAKDAELTSDPLQWASAPSQFDFPGVDTGPTFRDVEGDNFDTEGFLDSL